MININDLPNDMFYEIIKHCNIITLAQFGQMVHYFNKNKIYFYINIYMNNKLVSISILFVLILLLLGKQLKFHYLLIIFLSLILIYLIHFKLIIYLDNEDFQSTSSASMSCTSININNRNLDSEILENIMDKLSKFN